jgi:hypothetical protein
MVSNLTVFHSKFPAAQAVIQKAALVSLSMLVFAAASPGATITYATPAGATAPGSGLPVNASVTFVTSNNTLMITLTDALTNPTDVTEAISGLDFVLSNGLTSGSLTSSSGQEITINGDKSFSPGPTVSTGWGLINNVGGGLELQDLGFAGPSHLIVGAPGAGGTYSNANGSLTNSSHNPFLNQSATYQITISGVDSSTTITSVKFGFGTTLNANVVTGTTVAPEPSAMILFACGLIALGTFHFKRRRRA